jgi:4-aminobutyrate aminotransferase/(S)-3-amino-2-methylpropionate transaminase
LAVLEVIKGEKLLDRSLRLGERLQAGLRSLQKRFPAIGEIRGLGSMVAMELVKNGKADQPDADLTRALVQAAARHGLVILSCGTYGNVIRLLAPLTIPEPMLEEGLAKLEAALAEVTAAASQAAA